VDVHIDTLRLQVGGMDRTTAHRFARLVAERLSAALATWPAAPGPGQPGTVVPGPARLGSLRVAVGARAWDSPDSLAAHMATEVSRALRSASAPAGPRPGTVPAGEAMT
jgi:hypothetical protein